MKSISVTICKTPRMGPIKGVRISNSSECLICLYQVRLLCFPTIATLSIMVQSSKYRKRATFQEELSNKSWAVIEVVLVLALGKVLRELCYLCKDNFGAFVYFILCNGDDAAQSSQNPVLLLLLLFFFFFSFFYLFLSQFTSFTIKVDDNLRTYC